MVKKFCVIGNSVTLHFLSHKKRPKKQDADAHEGVRKKAAKRQRHPLGAAKCEFPVVKWKREGVRNSHFVLRKDVKLANFLYEYVQNETYYI